MTANQPNDDRPAAPAAFNFSLGTLMLIVTCAGVGAAGFRLVGSHENVVERLGVGMFFAGVFLAVWAIATRRRSLGRIAGLALLTGVLLAMIGPAVDSGSGPRRSSPCINNLRQISVVLQAYEQKYGSLPAAYVADANGKPLYSWRVSILPYLNQPRLAAAFHYDEAWDSPSNIAVAQTPLSDFQCPDDPQFASGSKSPPMTSYLAVVGPNTAWPGAKPRKLSEIAEPDETILVVEAENSGVNWAEPRDLYVGHVAARNQSEARARFVEQPSRRCKYSICRWLNPLAARDDRSRHARKTV